MPDRGLAPEVNLPLGMLGNSPDLLHCGRAITEVRKAGGWGGGSFGERVKGSCVVRWKWTLCHRAGIKLRKRQPEARRYDNHPWQPDRAPMQSQFIEFGQQAPSLPTVDHAHPGPPEVCMLWLTTPTLGHRKYARCGLPHPPWATGSMHAVAHHTHPGPPEVCTLWLNILTLGHRKYASCDSPYSPWVTGSMHAVAHYTHPGPPEVCTL